MAHIYMHFDFADEENAQQARHKLDVWKQAFRLDKKLQYKLERAEEAGAEEDSASADAATSPKDDEKPKSKAKSQPHKKSARTAGASEDYATGSVSLLVRLYFSSHEKLSEQRWLDRIPTEEPFKSASPKVLRQGEAGFEQALKQFSDLD
jgi:hypothetical protein